MDPVLLAQLAPLIAQFGMSTVQAVMAERLGNKVRPAQNIPPSLVKMLDLSYSRASKGVFPGQANAESELERTSANTMASVRTSAGSSANAVAAAGIVDQVESSGKRQIASTALGYMDKNQEELIRNIEKLGIWEQKKFETNEMEPYLINAQTKRDLVGASLQNFYGAANTAANNATYADIMKKMYPNSNPKSGTPDDGNGAIGFETGTKSGPASTTNQDLEEYLFKSTGQRPSLNPNFNPEGVQFGDPNTNWIDSILKQMPTLQNKAMYSLNFQ